MPIYEYLCSACCKRFEKLISSADGPAPACPDCGSHQVTKEPSSFAAAGRKPAENCSSGSG